MSGDLELAFANLRKRMVDEIAGEAADIEARVLAVMACVPRHRFVPRESSAFAYIDSPLPIGHGKTISAPFIVAKMTALLSLRPTDRVLDVGTGSGYQAAVLAELAGTVYTVEIIAELAEEAQRVHEELGYDNIEHRIGDGSGGWRDQAPFDKILVAAAPELIPEKLILQLAPGGKMVIPAGNQDEQILYLVEKTQRDETYSSEILPVRFSPLVRPN